MVNQGKIFYLDFKPSKGHEQRHKRPAIVLSNDLMAQTSNMSVIAPISTTSRNYQMYYQLTSTTKIHGKVLLDQTRAFDLQSRHVTQANVIESVTASELEVILNIYRLLFTTD